MAAGHAAGDRRGATGRPADHLPRIPRAMPDAGPIGEPCAEPHAASGGDPGPAAGDSAGGAPPTPPRRARPAGAPVAEGDRFVTLDLLRGVALCGILLMNILTFAWPVGAYTNVAWLYYALDSIGPVEDPEKRERDGEEAQEEGEEQPEGDATAGAKEKKKAPSSLEKERRERAREREPLPAYPRGAVRLCAVSGDADRVEFVLADLLVDNKMRTLFSLLFGAGVLIMTGHARQRGARAGWLHYRRMGWLVVIGALHGWLLWEGDILLPYAAVGLWLYPLRNRSARTLAVVGVVLLALPVVGAAFAPQIVDWVGRRGAAVEARLDGFLARADADPEADIAAEIDADVGWVDRLFLRGHRSIRAQRRSGQRPEQATRAIREELETGYLAGVAKRFWSMIGGQAGTLVFGFLGLGWPMLLGMALFKNGFLTGAWSARQYARWAAGWYAVGLPATWWALMTSLGGRGDLATRVRVVLPLELFGCLALTLAHAGAVLWLWRSGRTGPIAARLEAAGRMALTNYLAQSLLCAVLFSGFGLGLHGRVPRAGLLLVAVSIWAVELAWSPWWLARFRFGPVEWLWRSLTYWKWQPMRLPAGPA